MLDILAGAGALDPSERLLQFLIEAPLSVDDFWTLRSEMSEKLRAKLSILSEEQIAELRSEVIENLRPYYRSGRMSLPAEVLVVSGTKTHS